MPRPVRCTLLEQTVGHLQTPARRGSGAKNRREFVSPATHRSVGKDSLGTERSGLGGGRRGFGRRIRVFLNAVTWHVCTPSVLSVNCGSWCSAQPVIKALVRVRCPALPRPSTAINKGEEHLSRKQESHSEAHCFGSKRKMWSNFCLIWVYIKLTLHHNACARIICVGLLHGKGWLAEREAPSLSVSSRPFLT